MAKKHTPYAIRDDGLEYAFPSSPRRPPVFGFYFRYQGRTEYYNFCAKYAAKKFIEMCLDGNEHRWVDGSRLGYGEAIKDSTGLIIEGPGLENIMGYEYNEKETEWALPIPYSTYAKQIRQERHSFDGIAASVSNDKPVREKREKREKKPRVAREGLITVADIATSLECDAGEARSILRKANVEKPLAGWAWSTEEAEKIKAIISKGLKSARA